MKKFLFLLTLGLALVTPAHAAERLFSCTYTQIIDQAHVDSANFEINVQATPAARTILPLQFDSHGFKAHEANVEIDAWEDASGRYSTVSLNVRGAVRYVAGSSFSAQGPLSDRFELSAVGQGSDFLADVLMLECAVK